MRERLRERLKERLRNEQKKIMRKKKKPATQICNLNPSKH